MTNSLAIAFLAGMVVGAACVLFGMWFADWRAQRAEWKKWERRERRTRWLDGFFR